MSAKIKRKETVKPDFIEVYENAFSKEYCDDLVRIIDEYDSVGFLRERGESNIKMSDGAVYFPDTEKILYDKEIDIQHFNKRFIGGFNRVFWQDCYPEYSKKYGILSTLSEHHIHSIKAQKTNPGEGYHIWHCEQDNIQTASRIMAWSVYLNDDFEAGETEFLYQQKRIVPNKGDLIIFPSSYTHTHRGNSPIGGTKYILTGWVELG
jgi:hypothetical protein